MRERRHLLFALVTFALAVSSCGLGGDEGESSPEDRGAGAILAFQIRTTYRPEDSCEARGPEKATYFLQLEGRRAWLDVKGDGSTDAIREGEDLYLRNSVDPEVPWIHVRLGDNHLTAFAGFTRPGVEFAPLMFMNELADPLADAQRLADSGAQAPQPLDPANPEVATVRWSVGAEGQVTESQIDMEQTGPGYAVRSTVLSRPSDSANPPSPPANAPDLEDLQASVYAPTSALVDPSCNEGAAKDQEEVRSCIQEAAKNSTVREWLDQRQSTTAIDGSGC